MTSTANSQSRDLSELLASYLARSPSISVPGGDGMLVEEIVREYPAAANVRAVPGEVELCERHPHLAPHVVAFFFKDKPQADLD